MGTDISDILNDGKFIISFEQVDCSCHINTMFPYGMISDVKQLYPGKVIQVSFVDGDVQKAVCDREDEFSLERGIEVCLCKHFMGGTKEFNKQLKKGMKCYKDMSDARVAKLMEEIRFEQKKKKRAEQKKRREERRATEEREKRIADQTEAILRAYDILRNGEL